MGESLGKVGQGKVRADILSAFTIKRTKQFRKPKYIPPISINNSVDRSCKTIMANRVEATSLLINIVRNSISQPINQTAGLFF